MIKQTINDNMQEGETTPPHFLYTLLGPTASGKTALAIAFAKEIAGEIISIDSRQVYRGMDIGTGKDLDAYGNIPYHLIDIRDPKERYDIAQFQSDFHTAYQDIIARGKAPIAVGGTGMYMHSLIVKQPYIQVPVDQSFRDQLVSLDKPTLQAKLATYDIPTDFKIDYSSHKRIVRALEILEALKSGFLPAKEAVIYNPLVFGLDPALDLRRQRISERLKARLNGGMIQEVEQLLAEGVTHAELQFYGLEYKYSSMYLLGDMDRERYFTKLETEIHRYAKRQMTFFRKMEKDGVKIHWLNEDSTEAKLKAMLEIIKEESL
ncbi:tRNA (adenosine(37)-N6)-dimethylallyltransferase MiaA [Sphingobacterium bambusae]|uniref:tRNA dimethylallyltransferase n=1 Tax=Sphingobacterium bambusae TaxID=662858 RepID=A0ABW6BJQ2_9SPHI|nr:tRNA (adenosine(37)-N6)-dimethylallyltransferase MiaA [Sphingobacterium bambusae]WPL46738.1 tRNA (adenosine(37)-N6)-dimethylallyltransferase MiaA [Sphingobacterium bambusae]